MKKLLFVLPAIISLTACKEQPIQTLDLLCNDFRVGVNVYKNHADLDIHRIVKTNLHTFLGTYLPNTGDTMQITLKHDSESEMRFYDDNKQIGLLFSYDWLTHTVTPRIIETDQSYIECKQLTPNIYHTPDGPKDKAQITDAEETKIMQCIEQIETMGWDIGEKIDTDANNSTSQQGYILYVQGQEKFVPDNIQGILHAQHHFGAYTNRDGYVNKYETAACEDLDKLLQYLETVDAI